MNYKILIFISIISYTFNIKDAFSAAWTQGAGKLQSIYTTNLYQADHFFDENSKSQSSGGTFRKEEFNPFYEYGITNDVTIGASPLLQNWQVESDSSGIHSMVFNQCGVIGLTNLNQVSGAIIESEFFLRKKILEKGNSIFSIQPLVKTPCIFITEYFTRIIPQSYDLELRALAGYGFKWEEGLLSKKIRPFAGQYHFANLEMAYRKRTKYFSDQIKIDGTAGFRFNENILLLGQTFTTISTGDEVVRLEQSDSFFIPVRDDFWTTKVQFSTVFQLTKTTSLQLGAYTEPAGKNAGNGNGLLISVWKGF